ncbi:chaperone NapD [Ruegeria sp.]|uniref:chaperone NapD n=1 Tax=Ruegeria sp. TaxID=1879320 RepID=UPI0023163C33|nr:chaperone NapD [Ruegeria sp.]MDA7964429.1 chaperone NapD [Ruegeria sp.]
MNICGCLVHVTPDAALRAQETIENVEGAEVHAASDDGRLVVVVEDTDDRLASETIMDLHQIPGVISLSLTYHHFEDLAERRPQSNASRQI